MGAGPYWPRSSLIWLGNPLPASIDRKLNNWLRGEDVLVIFWTAQLLWNSKITEAATRPLLHRIEKFCSCSLLSAKKNRFPPDAVCWVQWGSFLLSGAIPSDDKIFATRPNCPWRQSFLAREASASIVLVLFFCLLHWSRFETKGGILTQSPSLKSFHHWVFLLLLMFLTPPPCWKYAKDFC